VRQPGGPGKGSFGIWTRLLIACAAGLLVALVVIQALENDAGRLVLRYLSILAAVAIVLVVLGRWRKLWDWSLQKPPLADHVRDDTGRAGLPDESEVVRVAEEPQATVPSALWDGVGAQVETRVDEHQMTEPEGVQKTRVATLPEPADEATEAPEMTSQTEPDNPPNLDLALREQVYVDRNDAAGALEELRIGTRSVVDGVREQSGLSAQDWELLWFLAQTSSAEDAPREWALSVLDLMGQSEASKGPKCVLVSTLVDAAELLSRISRLLAMAVGDPSVSKDDQVVKGLSGARRRLTRLASKVPHVESGFPSCMDGVRQQLFSRVEEAYLVTISARPPNPGHLRILDEAMGHLGYTIIEVMPGKTYFSRRFHVQETAVAGDSSKRDRVQSVLAMGYCDGITGQVVKKAQVIVYA